MNPNLVFAAFVAAITIYKQFYPTRFTRKVRRQMRRLLELESDEEFLKGALSEQAKAITKYARKMNRGKKLKSPVREYGYVYVARASIHDDRIPWGHHVKDWDRTFKRFVGRLRQASKDSLFKVGYTQREPRKRVNELNDNDRNVSGSIYWPYTFELAWSLEVADCAGVEEEAHKFLGGKRVAGEIFYTTEEGAIDAVRQGNSLRC